MPCAGVDVVGAGGARIEPEATVPASAPVVVVGAADEVAVRVVDAVKVRVRQCPGVRGGALEVDPVRLPRFERHRKPVPVTRVIDFPRGRAAHRNRSGGASPGRVVVVDFRRGHAVGSEPVTPGAGGDVVGAGILRLEDEAAVPADARVVVVGAADGVAVRVVDTANVRIFQCSGVRVRALEVDPVRLARFERDREPVLVARAFDLTRGRAAHRDRPGGAGPGRLVVGDFRHGNAVGPELVSIGAGGDIVGAGILRFEQERAVPADAPVAGAADEIAVRVVDAAAIRVYQCPGVRA